MNVCIFSDHERDGPVDKTLEILVTTLVTARSHMNTHYPAYTHEEACKRAF